MSRSLHEAINKVLDDISERYKRGGDDFVGLTTGFPTLDSVLGGLRPQAHYIVGGRPGMAKTSFILSMMYQQALLNVPNLLLSLEMSGELIALRTISMHTGIPSELIERGRLTKEEFEAVSSVKAITEKMPFRIIDQPLDSATFLEGVAQYQEKYGLKALFVDYASLFRDENKFGDNERLARVSNNMVNVAKLCNIPVITIAQLNREVEKRENHVPILSDLRDSGSLEQDAFAVLFCYRPHYYEVMLNGAAPLKVETDARIIIAKNRQGETGAVNLNFHPAQTLWTPKDKMELKLPPSLSENGSMKRSWVEKAREGR